MYGGVSFPPVYQYNQSGPHQYNQSGPQDFKQEPNFPVLKYPYSIQIIAKGKGEVI